MNAVYELNMRTLLVWHTVYTENLKNSKAFLHGVRIMKVPNVGLEDNLYIAT